MEILAAVSSFRTNFTCGLSPEKVLSALGKIVLTRDISFYAVA